MLYSIEIFPNNQKEVSTFFFVNDYSKWLNLLKKVLSNLCLKETVETKNRIENSIINHIKKDISSINHIKIEETSLVCLCTEEISTEQFKGFITRHSNDMALRLNKNKVDNMSVFFHWCRYHEFSLQSFQNVITSFQKKDYSFLVDEYGVSKFMLEEKEMSSIYQVDKWISASEYRSFIEYRVNLLKEQLIIKIEKNISLVGR